MHITSRQNARVKQTAKLRQRRQRDRQGRFLIDGLREIERALDAGVEPLEAFVCQPLCDSEAAERLAERLEQSTADVATVTPEVYEKLCFGDRHDGIVVAAATPTRTLESFRLPARPLVVVVEGLEKPGNVGAVIRTADGAGVDGVMVADPLADLWNPNTIRASLGAIFSLNLCVADSSAIRDWLRGYAVPIVAARPDATLAYDQFDFRPGGAIALGSEADGLSDLWQGDGVTAISLPMRGIADSLNVSATAAVLLYEAARQRQT